MEHPNIGEHCKFDQCKTLDFLPIICNFCKHTFCKDHFDTNKHNCVNIPNNNVDSSNLSVQKNIKCFLETCNTLDVVEMPCLKCENHFCLAHRHHGCFDFTDEEKAAAREEFSKPRREFAKALKEVDAKIETGIERNLTRSTKNRQTALKVQLMRLKGKAVGQASIPVAERIYFLVCPPKVTKAKSKAVFVSKEWSMGRVIDSTAAMCDIPNKNNISHAPKLRLFTKEQGTIVSNDMSCKLHEFIANGDVNNGESVILEYVSPEDLLACTAINVDGYIE